MNEKLLELLNQINEQKQKVVELAMMESWRRQRRPRKNSRRCRTNLTC